MPEAQNIPVRQVLSVCGGKLEAPDRYPSALFQGERVYFCTSACLAAFNTDPERFMAGKIEHPED